MKIIQIVDGFKTGDGVGNIAQSIERMLQKLGYETELYDHRIVGMNENKHDAEIFVEDNLVLYHLAFTMDPLVMSLPCRKILVFHNITEPNLSLGTDEKARIYCASGLFYTSLTHKVFEHAIVFSEYSRQLLIDNHWSPEDVTILPAILSLENFGQNTDSEIINQYKDGKINILFSGRVAPNKKTEDVIGAFAEYHKVYNRNSRLLLVGNISGGNYFPSLQKYVQNLGIDHSVVYTGKVSQIAYETYFKVADLFLCMSEHEGFCIPLVEAMLMEVPIIAYAATAVPDTLKEAGILVSRKDYGIIAELINRIMNETEWRESILRKQRERYHDLYSEKNEMEFEKTLQSVLSNEKKIEKFSVACNRKGECFKLTIKEEFILNRFENKKRHDIVLYGYGSFGKYLYQKFKDSDYAKVCSICDAEKGGTGEKVDEIEILTPEIAVQTFPDLMYIISIQNKSVSISVLFRLHELGIPLNRILLYDEESSLYGLEKGL